MHKVKLLVWFSALALTSNVCLFADQAENSETTHEKTYQPKSQILSLKAELFGGEFRITNVIPLHGDFSKYGRIEVVHLKSLIGDAMPQKEVEKYNQKVFKEFQSIGKIKDVETISDYQPPLTPAANDPSLQTQTTSFQNEDQDSLEAPMLTYDDLLKFDAIRKQKEAGEKPRTLVIAGEVISYVKGNHILQFLPFNIGSTIFTIRFRYYDKETGAELGRQVITGEVSADTYAGFLGLHSALSGIVEGLADQVTRRTISADR